MDFTGTGRRLAQGDVGDVARKIGMPDTASFLAFLEVEAAGRGFDAKNRPKILPEGHVFYRNLKGALRDKAVALGLAWRKWRRDYPGTSDGCYARLDRMVAVDIDAGLKACSWGIGQVLGENAGLCGFADVRAFVGAMKQGEYEQLLAMGGFMVSTGIPKMLGGKDLTTRQGWAKADTTYNGAAAAVHDYAGRLAAAYRKHRSGESMVLPDNGAVPVLKKGMKGEAVRNLQADLAAFGIDPGPVDGRYGDKTVAAVSVFQAQAGLTADGIAGPKTHARLAAQLAQRAAAGVPETEPETPAQPGQESNWIAALMQIVLKLLGR